LVKPQASEHCLLTEGSMLTQSSTGSKGGRAGLARGHLVSNEHLISKREMGHQISRRDKMRLNSSAFCHVLISSAHSHALRTKRCPLA
jgi:hypothetical protein